MGEPVGREIGQEANDTSFVPGKLRITSQASVEPTLSALTLTEPIPPEQLKALFHRFHWPSGRRPPHRPFSMTGLLRSARRVSLEEALTL
ncbi:hypothetical protein [Azospirillum sp. SYSU D00513]|uniref:hypothetical protein n=1 Tax=Azospirillum sp. SYSU D00513 TaxID=2812561 RepID=UPI001A973AB6|nr:hypothetical protein [Azospirillum sp. SYSU D00513]